jgi:hypothetical protein
MIAPLTAVPSASLTGAERTEEEACLLDRPTSPARVSQPRAHQASFSSVQWTTACWQSPRRDRVESRYLTSEEL